MIMMESRWTLLPWEVESIAVEVTTLFVLPWSFQLACSTIHLVCDAVIFVEKMGIAGVPRCILELRGAREEVEKQCSPCCPTHRFGHCVVVTSSV